MNKLHPTKPGFVCGLLTVMLLAAGCGAKPPVPTETVPADASGVARVDLKQLVECGLYGEVLAMAVERGVMPQVIAALELVNLDPEAELETAVFVKGDLETETAVIVIGTFDEDTVRQALKKTLVGTETTYKKYKLLQEPKGRLVGAINKHVLVYGEEKTAKKVLDILKGDAEPMAPDAGPLARVKEFSGETFWFTTKLESLAEGESNAPQRLAKLMPGPDLATLETLTVAGTVTSKAIVLKMVVGCADNQSAEKLRGRIRNRVDKFAAAVEKTKQADPESAKLVRALVASANIESNDCKVVAGLKVDLELISLLRKERRKKDRQKDLTLACRQQLERIVKGCNYHVIDDGQFFPGALHELADKGMIRRADLTCPASWPDNLLGRVTYGSAFGLTAAQLTPASLPPDMLLVWDNAPRHGGKRCVAFADGHVEVLAEADFQKRLEALRARLASLK